MSQGFNEEKLRKAPTIRLWLQDARRNGAEHMIILRSQTTGEEFPLLSGNGRGPRKTFSDYLDRHPGDFDPIECYDMSIDLENQVLQDSTQNWDRHLSVQTGPISGVVPGPIGNEGPNMPNPDPDEFVGRKK